MAWSKASATVGKCPAVGAAARLARGRLSRRGSTGLTTLAALAARQDAGWLDGRSDGMSPAGLARGRRKSVSITLFGSLNDLSPRLAHTLAASLPRRPHV